MVSAIAFEWHLLGVSKGLNLVGQIVLAYPFTLFVARLLGQPWHQTDTGGVLGALLLPALAALLLLAWERLSGLSAEERREIGVLKAVGWATEDVLAVRMIEAGLIAIFGTVIGLLVAYVHVYVFEAALLSRVIFGWSNLRTPLALAPATDLATLAALVAMVVVPFTTVSTFPAWRAASIDPDRALRGP
jgi:hypothetical protein